jgi:hypothetical protein
VTTKTTIVLLLSLSLVSVGVVCAAEGDEEAPVAATETAEADGKDRKKLTGAEKRAEKDQEIAALVEQYNDEVVETDLDEVVCERIRVTGTRRKVQVCKTKRELLAEQESAQRMLLQRKKAGSDPAQSSGVGSN